jgi:glycosyl transferase family 25
MKIDRVYFINLDHRKDRLEHITDVLLNKLKIPKKQIKRINGIYTPENGAIGCALSHIKILKNILRNKYEVSLILEDDFDVYDSNIFWEGLNNFSNEKIDWDLVQVSANLLKSEETKWKFLTKVLESQTTSGYLIHRNFIRKLLNVYKESYVNLQISSDYKWAIDQNWKKIQPDSKWYCFNPKLGYQIDGFSDIEKIIVNYKC